MARSDQGNPLLHLVLQPGGRFKEGRGGFDSGTRVFQCDAGVAEKIAPRVGESDVVILKRALAGPTTRRKFPRMYADDVDSKDLENGRVEFTVSYLGLMYEKGKHAFVESTTDSQQLSEVPTGGTVNRVTFMRALPRVRVTWVSLKPPDQSRIGSHLTPPGYTAEIDLNSYFTVFRSEQDIIFQGWILAASTNRPVGDQRTGAAYEVSDDYAYMIHEKPTS